MHEIAIYGNQFKGARVEQLQEETKFMVSWQLIEKGKYFILLPYEVVT